MKQPSFKLKNGEEYYGIKISYSRASSYQSCPAKHYYSYVENLRTKGVVRPLSFGGDFHSLLEVRHKPKKLIKTWDKITSVYNDLSPNMQSKLGDDYLAELGEVFSDYQHVWSGSEKPIELEHEFLVLMGKINGIPVYFHGIVDEIYEDNEIGEHKTFNQQPDMAVLAMNTQVCLYSKAREIETGVKANRVRWDYIKSTPAKRPIWLDKSQRFSEATNQQITHLSWVRACLERGVTDQAIINKSEIYKPNISNFYFRVGMDIVPQMVDTVWRGFKSVAKNIVLHGETNNVKNITRDCTWCDYRPICFAEFTGGDAEYVKKTDYETRVRE